DARGPGRLSSRPMGSQVSGNPEGRGSFLNVELRAKRFAGRPNLTETFWRYRAAMDFRPSVSFMAHRPRNGYVGCRSVIARVFPGRWLGMVSCHTAGWLGCHCVSTVGTSSSRWRTRWTHAVSAQPRRSPEARGDYVTGGQAVPEASFRR